VGYGDYIETIEALDPKTVVVKAKLDEDGNAVNPLLVKSYISSEYVVQKAWTQTLEARAGEDATALKEDTAEDFVASGPYTKFYNDEQKVVFVRDDNYWGQDESMWGTLPVPKYLAHTIYADNNAGFLALKAGEVDVSQQFNANVQDLWLEDGLPISTWMDEAPYGLTASLPTAYFNLESFGLDNVAVRKAIAMAVDYDTIIANAMTNQSPTFNQVPRSVMNPTDGEQALYDHEAVADLQWAGNDIEGANTLLDEAGIVDSDGDGWREIDGQNLSYNAVCPNGWSDWQAAIEIVAAAGEEIGIEITTLYPEWGVYQTVFVNGDQTEYDIFMVWSDGAGPTQPWGRVRQLMSSEFAETQGNWNGNWGGYINPRIDEIIAEIPATTDQARLVELYTEATKIYLTDIPSFSLMYRPDQFYTVNESVWTNYPAADDGRNIPPMNLLDGYSIAGLYELELVNP
jgi:peptide/nickel transport system substrate-binding protein